jgi:hypothetical protein
MYSDSGRNTIVIDDTIPGAPLPLAGPDMTAIAALERQLPRAPDGTSFKYANPFRCPECSASFVDFETHPGQREQEYYGLYLPNSELLHFPG